jgi:peptide/nickel transport system ATP-binding protein
MQKKLQNSIRRIIMNEIFSDQALLETKKVCKTFGSGKNAVNAVIDVDFQIHQGEIISIVGTSGSGKTTLAKILLGLLKETSGEILYKGKPRLLKNQKERRAYWQNIQAIFQDPFSTFNQFFRVDKILNDCLKLQGLEHISQKEKTEKMQDACKFVNLKYEELYNKYPFELSGGQMQRLMIARIFMVKPNILIADEPTSMIDACSRSTILDMLMKLREEEGMTILFITHDLGLAYYLSDTIYIMESGRIVENGSAKDVILHPKDSYTKQLVSDVPKLHEEWVLNY